MSKEKFVLTQIKKIVSEPMKAWKNLKNNPEDDKALEDWKNCSLRPEDLIEIFQLIEINDLIQ